MVFRGDANAVIANKEDWVQMLVQPPCAYLHIRIGTAAGVFGRIFQKILHDFDQPFPVAVYDRQFTLYLDMDLA